MSKPPIRAPPVEARPPPKPGQGIKLETIAKEKAGQQIRIIRYGEDPRKVDGEVKLDEHRRPYVLITASERAYIRPGHRLVLTNKNGSAYFRDAI